jgi:hypothetical protein
LFANKLLKDKSSFFWLTGSTNCAWHIQKACASANGTFRRLVQLQMAFSKSQLFTHSPAAEFDDPTVGFP